MSVPSYPISGLGGTVSFGKIECNEISIIPTSTDFNIIAKNANFGSTQSTTALRSVQKIESGSGAYMAPLLQMGVDVVNWIMNISDTTDIWVGMYSGVGSYDEPLSPSIFGIFVGGDAINEIQIITLSLTLTQLIVYSGSGTSGGVLGTRDIPLLLQNTFMYPWLCCPPRKAIRVSNIRRDVRFVMTCLQNGSSFVTGLNNGITDFSVQDIVDNSQGSGPIPGANFITNGSGQSVVVQADGAIVLTGGLTYALTTAPTNYVLPVQNSHIIVSDPSVTFLTLPSANSFPGQNYVIFRTYPLQPGENIFSPYLNILASGLDTIAGLASIGLQAKSSLRVVSLGSNTWVIT